MIGKSMFLSKSGASVTGAEAAAAYDKLHSLRLVAPALDHDAMMKARFGHSVSVNGRLERDIVFSLLTYLESKGFRTIATFDGEVRESTHGSVKKAMEFIFNLDDVSVRVKKVGYSEHGIRLVLGNGVDVIADWNYFDLDDDGFNAAMEGFDVYEIFGDN